MGKVPGRALTTAIATVSMSFTRGPSSAGILPMLIGNLAMYSALPLPSRGTTSMRCSLYTLKFCLSELDRE